MVRNLINKYMTREIKFRAWDKKTNSMISEVFELGLGDRHNPETWLVGDDRQTDSFDLMQYTGLKDKNGKEIFEGDILQIKEYFNEDLGAKLSEIGVVIFNDGRGKFEQVGYQVKITLFKDGEVWRDNVENLIKSRYDKDGNNNEEPTTCWEIIGNIYENPELLEAKND